MSRVSTENVSLRYGVETALNTPPTGANDWRILEPNDISKFGPDIKTVARRPISPRRGRRKGTVVDLDSPPELKGDLTVDSFLDFIEAYVYAEFANVDYNLRNTANAAPPAVTNGFTISAASAALGDKVQFVAVQRASLLVSKGYATAANNGLFAITVDLASTNTTITAGGQGIVTEASPPTNASLLVAGVRVLATNDLTLTITGSTATLVSAASITTAGGTTTPGWASLGVQAGMWIHIGSGVPATGALQNGLGTLGTQSYGYARVVSVTPTTLNLDKLDPKLVTATTNSAGVCDVLFGRFARNVATSDAVADRRYIERTVHIEASYPNLGGVGVTQFEYSKGNYADSLTFELPVADKALITWGFVGTDTEVLTSSRKTGASTAIDVLRSVAFNTSSNIISLTTNLVSLVSDVCFKDLTVKINDNTKADKCLGVLGAAFVNVGLFEVSLSGKMLFTNKTITDAVRNNTTVTWANVMTNEDGTIVMDLPAFTCGDGSREFPRDESVHANLKGETFTDPTFGFDVGFNVLVGTPTQRP